MKKNSPLRLKLNRETLRALTGLETGEAQGGSLATCVPSIYVTQCNCPTQSCPTRCGVIC
jgi:hypothetical protein